MKTEKRNARTTKIFNGIMTGLMRKYNIKEDISLKQIYDAIPVSGFNFLDTNGNIICNSIGKDFIRGLSFPKLTTYIFSGIETKSSIIKEFSLFSFDKYDLNLVKDYDITDIKREFSKYGVDYGISKSNTSTFLKSLFDNYRLDKFHKRSYLFLIEFETIFGYHCMSRKEFDRIRYIYFDDTSIYDVMNGYMIPGVVIYNLSKKYYLDTTIEYNISNNIEFPYDCSRINILKLVFPKIKNMLCDIGSGRSEEEIYDFCSAIMFNFCRPSLKHLISENAKCRDLHGKALLEEATKIYYNILYGKFSMGYRNWWN